MRRAPNSNMRMHYQWVMLECTDVGISFKMGLALKTGKLEALGILLYPFPYLLCSLFPHLPLRKGLSEKTLLKLHDWLRTGTQEPVVEGRLVSRYCSLPVNNRHLQIYNHFQKKTSMIKSKYSVLSEFLINLFHYFFAQLTLNLV